MTDLEAAPVTMSPWQRFTAAQQERNPAFEARTSQSQLAEAITLTTSLGLHLVAEAPTGVGKSYAGLVPSISLARAKGKPVVVATPSKTLQAQYFTKDLPVLNEHIGPVRSALLFGRANYACLAKLHGLADLTDERLTEITDALSEAGDLVIGLPEHVRLTTAEKAEITTTSNECPGARSCEFGADCFYELAKKRAADADVIVTNTAMLVADAQTEGRVLPERSALIIDEAHKLPDAVIEALGWDLSKRGARRLHRAIEKVLDDVDERIVDLVEDILGALSPEPSQRENTTVQRRIRQADLAGAAPLLDGLREWLGNIDSRIARAIGPLKDRIEDAKDRGDGGEQQEDQELLDGLEAARRQVAEYRQRVRDMAGFRDDAPVVLWSEHNGRTAKLAYRPLDIAPWLTERVWSRGPAVLMSATVPADLADAAGLPQAVRINVASPFDLAGNSRRYIADITPQTKPGDPDGRDRWLDRVAEETTALILAAGGRALVLFASYGDLDQVYWRTQDAIARAGITLLRQERGADTERQHLIHQFKTDETSVLYGVASFEEGVDVPGDALSLVIVTRVPNATPDDPVFAKRVELAGGGWGGYGRVNGPAVAVRMAQSAGRLIRTTTDTGLVAILDGRVRKFKGRAALTKLPDVPTLYRLADATAYLLDLGIRRQGGNVIPLRNRGAC